ncbi:MAG: hypothetical protein KIT11_07015 [Fimbriimonadaceae bacterium]|nr:hypothetical protein [Fimbriimonadaceae bacterium]QYK56102.1 MAG: hypothetical protein KF733_01205 [Fimbriimonadaceae bacterium]
MVTAQGKRSGLEVQVVRTDEGIRALRLVTSILLTVAHARYENVGGNSTVDKLKAWQKQATEDSKLLERIGINGIFRSDEEGLIAWDRWRLLNEERLARVTAQSVGQSS